MSAALPSGFFSPELEAAFELLDDALFDIHPEHGEYDEIKRARDAVEAADVALERITKIQRGEVA